MKRAEKIRGWLQRIASAYEDSLSRPSELSSLSGFDDSPRKIPCEHRPAWARERLCLACNNSGWRPATAEERRDGSAVDPYAADPSSGMTVVRHESESAKRARDSRRIDAVLAVLRQNERIRANVDASETVESRLFGRVSRRTRTEVKILRALEHVRAYYPDIYADVPSEGSLRFLARIIPGQIPQPPEGRS